MRTALAVLASVVFSSVPVAAQVCTESSGTVYCPNGVTGFRDSSGDLWIGKGRQGTVILNMDNEEPREAPRRKPKFCLIDHDTGDCRD